MRLFGQTFTASTIERIRGAVAAECGLTRSALSRRVCEWLGWHDAKGKPKEVSSRKALVELERRGVITLPEAQRMAPQARCALPAEPFTAPAFAGSLEELGAVELVAVEDRTLSSLYRRMLESHHPLGGGALCGAQQRYLIRSPRIGWLGALAFSAAAWQLAARDDWIGWCPHARRANLSRVVANSRFLILPSIAVANLGSHVLALAARQVVVDWRRRYGYAPVLLETFVDERCFAATVYKAANWQRLGESAGRGRQDRDNRAALGAKGIYVLPLQRDWRSVLCQRPVPMLRLPPPTAEPSWVEEEFGRVDFPDARLRPRLLGLAQAFFEQPIAPIPMALHGDAVPEQSRLSLLQQSPSGPANPASSPLRSHGRAHPRTRAGAGGAGYHQPQLRRPCAHPRLGADQYPRRRGAGAQAARHARPHATGRAPGADRY
jgi:hypothetical protein